MNPLILDHLPGGLLDLPATELHRHLDGPTLIHLPGRRPRPLFVSVLQHGNEVSGWEAVRRLLKGRYARDPLPRSLILLISNVRAAARGQRHLVDQPDFNRCWPGTAGNPTIWHRLFADITAHVRKLEPFASIDIHNNTGQNPHYAAVNRIEARRLQLAALFSRTVVYFTEPRGVQSMAFGEFCPAVTLECGLAGAVDGADHALAYLETVLNLEQLPEHFPAPENLELFRMMATVTIDEDTDFGFGPEAGDLRLPPDLDRLNFNEMPPGTRLGQGVNGNGIPLRALGHNGEDLTPRFFDQQDGQIITTRPLMPAMLTTDADIIRQDCLCYLMERVGLEERRTEQSGLSRAGLPEAEP
jgi:succinylglutamate desuccinylase